MVLGLNKTRLDAALLLLLLLLRLLLVLLLLWLRLQLYHYGITCCNVVSMPQQP